jgi:NTE family protein
MLPAYVSKHFCLAAKARMDPGAMTRAFVLAGGGSLGAVQVGMLRALAEHGMSPDFVVGSSVGAINGAYFAGSPTLEGVAGLEKLWLGVRRSDIFGVSIASAAGFLLRRDFLMSSDGLRGLIERHLPYRRLEEALVPVHVVATDLLSGEAVVMSRGNAADAILASSAIPAAFAPVVVDGRYLVDGAITSNTPVRVAIELGATRIVVLPTGFACALDNPPRGAIANALHALTLLIARQLVAELEAVDPAIHYAIAPTLCPLEWSAYDFSHAADMIATSSQMTRQWIADGGLDRREIPDALRAHSH